MEMEFGIQFKRSLGRLVLASLHWGATSVTLQCVGTPSCLPLFVCMFETPHDTQGYDVHTDRW
jgi:hypothetical protein